MQPNVGLKAYYEKKYALCELYWMVEAAASCPSEKNEYYSYWRTDRNKPREQSLIIHCPSSVQYFHTYIVNKMEIARHLVSLTSSSTTDQLQTKDNYSSLYIRLYYSFESPIFMNTKFKLIPLAALSHLLQLFDFLALFSFSIAKAACSWIISCNSCSDSFKAALFSIICSRSFLAVISSSIAFSSRNSALCSCL